MDARFRKRIKFGRGQLRCNETGLFYIAVTHERDNERTAGNKKEKTKDGDIFSESPSAKSSTRARATLTGSQVFRAIMTMTILLLLLLLLVNPLLTRTGH